jgi:hypothetical protein
MLKISFPKFINYFNNNYLRMGCSHSTRNPYNIKRKATSMGVIMNFKEERDNLPNKEAEYVNITLLRSLNK